VAKVDYMQQAVAKAMLQYINRILSVFRRQVREQVEAAALQVPPALAPPPPSLDAIRPTGSRSEQTKTQIHVPRIYMLNPNTFL
jgi:hypothetical protein